MQDPAKYFSDYWRKLHQDTDLATVRARIAAATGEGKSVGIEYLKEIDEKQEDSKHEDSITGVMEANKILARANKLSLWALIVSLGATTASIVAVGLSIWVAFFKDC